MAWVTTKGSNRGRADVYLDGVKVATVDLYSPNLQTRRAMWATAVDPTVTHTLEVRPLGTKNTSASAAIVDLDGVVILR